MELEEAVKILNDLKENVALFSTGWYPILKESERRALETVLTYIKEESIPRAVVEDKIKAKIEEIKDGTFDAKIVLQSLLKKE
jgi:hypothetical protein